MKACALCGRSVVESQLQEAGWSSAAVSARLAGAHLGWKRSDGACPSCLQLALLTILLERGEKALHLSIQAAWPMDPEAAFGALPTPLRCHADPRFTGRGVTMAIVDAGFFPHPDLVEPQNRVRAVVDASRDPVEVWEFDSLRAPEWPGWDAGRPGQWHGLMTTTAAAGNGALSHGLYRGLASDASLVLIQVADREGHIGNDAIARALTWLDRHGPEFGVRVVNLSLGGEAVSPLAGNPVDEAVRVLVERRITVVAAAGNDGQRSLVPPGTAPWGLTIGGIDDHNTFDHGEVELWHSNYGETAGGAPKPELVAPSLWVVAPILPRTDVARDAAALFQKRAASLERDSAVEERISELKLVTPHYQHVEGTSFASPLVASAVACMIEANPKLTPRRIREILVATALSVPGAPAERQGAGVLAAGHAVTMALSDRHGSSADYSHSPLINGNSIHFMLHDHRAEDVKVLGSWDGWQGPGLTATVIEPGIWRAELKRLAPGSYTYKFLIDGERWLCDPANPARGSDGFGGCNSLVRI